MSRAAITPSVVESIDRKIEDAVGRIMRGAPRPGDYCVVADLTAQRTALSMPRAFGRIQEVLAATKRAG